MNSNMDRLIYEVVWWLGISSFCLSYEQEMNTYFVQKGFGMLH